MHRLPLVERLLAPGADAALTEMMRAFLAGRPHPQGRAMLDVGVGTRSLVRAAGFAVVGLDQAPARVHAFRRSGGCGLVATATALPFVTGSFDVVVSVWLLHHLSDADARTALAEMLRVARPDGSVAVFDGVHPEPAWRRPFAWAVRRADRGRFMRRADALQALLPEPAAWRHRRLRYAWTGLEGLWCIRP